MTKPGQLLKLPIIDPANFTPFPKNPVIARFFKQIGRVDELGSGIRNTFKYCGIYTPGTKPEFIEGDVFKTVIPLKPEEVTTRKTTQKTTQKTEDKILDLIRQKPEISRREIAQVMGDITEDGVKYQLNKLKKEGRIKRIGADKGGYWKIKKVD